MLSCLFFDGKRSQKCGYFVEFIQNKSYKITTFLRTYSIKKILTLVPALLRDFEVLKVDDRAPREDETAKRGTR